MSKRVNQQSGPLVAGAGLSIKDAGAYLRVPAPTLRSWELRYGLPTTARSIGGHRRYQTTQLVQLSLMRDEIAIGRQPADAARWVRSILDENNPGVGRVHALLTASKRLDVAEIQGVIELSHSEIGLTATLDQVILPAMRQIGAWWESGDCDIGRDHLTTQIVRRWLAKIVTLAPARAADTGTVLLATGPEDLHTLGLEALGAELAQRSWASRLLGPRTSPASLLTAARGTADAVAVVVSHLPSQRRSAVDSLRAVARLGVPTFYAGNAFLFPQFRKAVPGTYLGESIGQAAQLLTGVRFTSRAS